MRPFRCSDAQRESRHLGQDSQHIYSICACAVCYTNPHRDVNEATQSLHPFWRSNSDRLGKQGQRRKSQNRDKMRCVGAQISAAASCMIGNEIRCVRAVILASCWRINGNEQRDALQFEGAQVLAATSCVGFFRGIGLPVFHRFVRFAMLICHDRGFGNVLRVVAKVLCHPQAKRRTGWWISSDAPRKGEKG